MSNFQIAAKGGDPESLETWRKYCLALNATRRFRYCADLEKRKELAAALEVRPLLFLLLDSHFLFINQRNSALSTHSMPN